MKVKVERLLISVFAIAILTLWKSLTLLSSLHQERKSNDVVLVHSPPPKHGNYSNSASSAAKPYFILHIGPPKTATTYIQCNLDKLSKGLANDDSYYFVGKNCPGSNSTMENDERSIPGHYLMMGLNEPNTKNRGYEKLKSRMDYHRAKGNNIIYSNEAFTNHLVDQKATWDCLKTMFSGWNVRVVIGYRHYFDWIRSWYYQTHKQNAKLDQFWPDQDRGRPHPSFLDYLDYHLQRREAGNLSVDGGLKNDAFGHHLTISAYKKFSPHFDDIQIIDLYDEDMFSDFVCRVLPNAAKTCRKLRTVTEKGKHEVTHGLATRASQSFDAHRIAEAAYDKGYIPKSSPKKKVIKLLKTRIEKLPKESLSKFLVCPTTPLVSRLLNVSIEYEYEMLEISRGELSASEKEKAKNTHLLMYRQDEANERFCDIDPVLILKSEDWVTFLSEIGKSTAKS